MMGKILPVLLALIGLGAGIGAGITLKPGPQEIAEMAPCGELGDENASNTEMAQAEEAVALNGEELADARGNDFVKMNNQFVVPVVSESKVNALVVMSLSLEIVAGGSEQFYQREPKLRDAFLQILFDHANSGGFDGIFTEGRKLDNLRTALFEIAQKIMGNTVIDVLVTDILRQDV